MFEADQGRALLLRRVFGYAGVAKVNRPSLLGLSMHGDRAYVVFLAAVFADHVFWDAVRNTAVQVRIAVPLMIPLSFMLGYYVSLNPRGHRLLRVLLFSPAALR